MQAQTSKKEGTYTLANDAYSKEWVMLQYDTQGSQDYWEVNYQLPNDVSSPPVDWGSKALTSTQYASADAKTVETSPAVDLTAAAATATSGSTFTNAVLLDTVSAKGWDGTTYWPGHSAYKPLASASSGTDVVPVYEEDEFTAWYDAVTYSASALPATTTAVLIVDNSRTTLWGAASSLTAAATVVVAASLF